MYAYEMIELSELTDLELLKTKCIYSDDFQELTKERQKEIYDYCRRHATFPMIKRNLEQIRYAVTNVYFGYAE